MSMILQKIVLTYQILSSIAPWHKYDQKNKNYKIKSHWTDRKYFFVKKSSISLLVEDIQIIFMLSVQSNFNVRTRMSYDKETWLNF